MHFSTIFTVRSLKSLFELLRSLLFISLMSGPLKIWFCQFARCASLFFLRSAIALKIKVFSRAKSDWAISKSDVPSSASWRQQKKLLRHLSFLPSLCIYVYTYMQTCIAVFGLQNLLHQQLLFLRSCKSSREAIYIYRINLQSSKNFTVTLPFEDQLAWWSGFWP